MCLNFFAYMDLSVPHACLASTEVRRGDSYPGTGVTGAYESRVGAENQTQEISPSLHYFLRYLSQWNRV